MSVSVRYQGGDFSQINKGRVKSFFFVLPADASFQKLISTSLINGTKVPD